MKSKKKIILFIIALFLLAFFCMGIGFYFNRLSKASHVMKTVINHVEEQLTRYFYPKDELFVGDDFTLEETSHFDLNSEYYPEKAQLDEKSSQISHLIHNLNQLNSHILWKHKASTSQAFLELDGHLAEENLIHKKIYVENSTQYYFIDGLVKNYINNGTCNYFETIYEDNSLEDNVEFLYHTFFDAFHSSLREDYFERVEVEEKIDGKNQKVYKTILRLNDKRVHQILKNILQYFEEDEKAKVLLQNIYPDFFQLKVSDDAVFLEKEESYQFVVYTTRFFYQPLKYEFIHMNGDDIESYYYEGDLEKGRAYYIKNNQLIYQFVCMFDSSKIDIQILDSFEKNLGEFKLERNGVNHTINYSFDSDHKNYDFIYSSKFTNFKARKMFENTQKMSFKFVEDQKTHLGGEIVLETKVENMAKIEEDVSLATLASRLDDEEKTAVDKKWEQVRERMLK